MSSGKQVLHQSLLSQSADLETVFSFCVFETKDDGQSPNSEWCYSIIKRVWNFFHIRCNGSTAMTSVCGIR